MHVGRLDNVTVHLGSRVVLDGVTLDLESATVVAVMGPSGAGKTTLLHVLGRMIRPTTGSMTPDVEASHRIAWIVQNSPVLSRRTCQENIALGALAKGVGWDKAQILAARILRELGLERSASTMAFRLSGGEKQRVAVGRAIASDASIILADEPTASLDADSRELVCGALQTAAARGSAVIVTTHDEHVADAADCVLRLQRGRLVGRSSQMDR